ncbi:hypothetical protein AXZ77_0750 [Thioclava sp. ES.031]|nr:hypothetical protein AXZ77_0750 [Thioclava sp. ES.031]
MGDLLGGSPSKNEDGLGFSTAGYRARERVRESIEAAVRHAGYPRENVACEMRGTRADKHVRRPGWKGKGDLHWAWLFLSPARPRQTQTSVSACWPRRKTGARSFELGINLDESRFGKVTGLERLEILFCHLRWLRKGGSQDISGHRRSAGEHGEHARNDVFGQINDTSFSRHCSDETSKRSNSELLGLDLRYRRNASMS